MKRNFFYRVDKLNQLLTIEFCPYCGTDNMYVYISDSHNYTVCFECEDKLEFMRVIEELEE